MNILPAASGAEISGQVCLRGCHTQQGAAARSMSARPGQRDRHGRHEKENADQDDQRRPGRLQPGSVRLMELGYLGRNPIIGRHQREIEDRQARENVDELVEFALTD